MSWYAKKIEDLRSRSEYVLEMQAVDPEDMPDDEDVMGSDRGLSAIMQSHDEQSTLVVESGVDRRGHGFIVAASLDAEGEEVGVRITSVDGIFDLSPGSVMIQSSDLDTNVRQE